MTHKLRGSRRGRVSVRVLSSIVFLAAAVVGINQSDRADAVPPWKRNQPVSTPTGSATALWSADHDDATTADWASGGGGGIYTSGAAEAVASTEQHRSGSHALRTRISTPSTPSAGVRAVRWAEARANRDLYYGAWVYLPQTIQPTGNYLNLLQFTSRSQDNTRQDPVWAFYGAPDGKGGIYLRAGWGWGGTPLPGPRATDGVSGKWFEPTQRVSVPVGRWVHLEAFLRQSNAFDGQLELWQDGVQLFDLSNVRTSFHNCNYNSWCASNEWSVNLYSDGLSVSPATMYVDDAVMARSASTSTTTSTTAPTSVSPSTTTTVVASSTPTTTTPTTAPATTPTTAPTSGPAPALLWSAGQDGGNTDEWSANGGGGLYNSGSYEAVASSEQHLDGSHSLRARIWMPSSPTSGVRAFRWAEARANRELYYSTWIYLPQRLDPTSGFLNMFQFKSRSTDGRNDPVWAFYGASDGNGGAYLKAGWGWGGTPLSGPHSSDGVGGKWIEPSQRVSLPVGRWVHIEAFLRQSKDFDGRLQLWQDGVQLFNLDNVRTSFSNCNYNSWCGANEWSVNLYSDGLSVNPATLYIDKSAIARSYIP